VALRGCNAGDCAVGIDELAVSRRAKGFLTVFAYIKIPGENLLQLQGYHTAPTKSVDSAELPVSSSRQSAISNTIVLIGYTFFLEGS